MSFSMFENYFSFVKIEKKRKKKKVLFEMTW